MRTPLPGSIGERIRAQRKAQGLTQVKLAALVGMGQSAISAAEAGDTAWLQGPNMLNMARALKVSARWLQTGTGDPQQPVGASTDDAVVLDILRALSEDHRAAWIAVGATLLNSQAERPATPSDPFPHKKSTRKQHA
jgi:transcriptional regulator with XRE-family HTH domain